MDFVGMGDSLMQFNDYSTYPQSGWFQMLDRFMVDPKENHLYDFALNGRSTKSFIDEGQYKKALEKVSKGTYVLISFGHNDEKSQDPTRYCPPFTTYQENLKMFYNDITSKGGIPIFLSSIERVIYDENGKLSYTHKEYVKAMEEICKKLGAYYIDLNKLSHDFYAKNIFEENKKYIMYFPKGTYPNYDVDKIDTTHLSIHGAMNICHLVVPELRKIDGLKDIFIEY